MAFNHLPGPQHLHSQLEPHVVSQWEVCQLKWVKVQVVLMSLVDDLPIQLNLLPGIHTILCLPLIAKDFLTLEACKQKNFQALQM